MTYSCTDFSEDVFNELQRVGAIHQGEAADDDLDDNPGRQADYALAGIARLVEVKDAFVLYRHAVENLASHLGVSLQDGVFCEADERAKKALAQIGGASTSKMAKATVGTDAIGFEPAAACTTEFPRGALHGQMQIGDQSFHVEAYQVSVSEDGVLTPVLAEYSEEVEALYTLAGNSLSTQEIDGYEYVIAAFPHAN